MNPVLAENHLQQVAKRRRKRLFVLLETATVVVAVVGITVYGDFLCTLGELSFGLRHYHAAETLYKLALSVQEKAFGRDSVGVSDTLNSMAYFYYDLDQVDKAMPLADRSVAICRRKLRPQDPRLAWTLSIASLVYGGSGKFVEAERMAREALPILEAAYGRQSLPVASTLNRLGLALDGQGRFPEAEATLQRALAVREAWMDPDSVGLLPILHNLTSVYSEEGKEQEASAARNRADSIAAHHHGRSVSDTDMPVAQVQSRGSSNASSGPDELNKELVTAVIGCRGKVNIEAVRSLLQRGADPNAADTGRDSLTALMFAAKNGQTEVVKLLLDSGAKVNTRAKLPPIGDRGFVLDGVTALWAGAFSGNAAVVKMLMERGADIHALDSRGASVMLIAGSNEVVQLFLDRGLDINARDVDGLTLLIISAAALRREPDVAFLLRNGADPNAKAKNGLTPLSAARGRPEVVELLKKAGARERKAVQGTLPKQAAI